MSGQTKPSLIDGLKVTEAFAAYIARWSGWPPTPSDSAMTAEAKMLTPEQITDIARSWGSLLAEDRARNIIRALLAHIAALSTDRTKLAADLARVEGERDALKSDRARSISRGRILIRVRDALINIKEDIESEVDRTYFGSMNDADMFCKIVDELDAFKWDRIMAEKSEPDVIEECRKANERALSAEAKSARLVEALKVPEVWGQTERDGMAAAFDEADGKRGHYETLFAVAAWLLRHRQSIALTLPEPSHEP